MTRLEMATRILAGICANPADAYTQGEVAITKALDLADDLVLREKITSHDTRKKAAGHE